MEAKKYLDKHGMETMADLLKFGRKKIWHGTAAEWEALPEAMKQQYDQAEVIDDAEIIGGGDSGGSVSSGTDLSQLSARIDGIENKANANTSAITVERQERVAKDTEQDSHINTAQSNIAQLQLKVTSLENKTDNDTVYDDTALKARVAALEAAIENLGNGGSSAVYDSGWQSISNYVDISDSNLTKTGVSYRRIGNVVYIGLYLVAYASPSESTVTTISSKSTATGIQKLPGRTNGNGYFYTVLNAISDKTKPCICYMSDVGNAVIKLSNYERGAIEIYGSYITDDPIPA